MQIPRLQDRGITSNIVNMSTSYFAKELPEQPIYINGQAMRFDVFATSDPDVIQKLSSAAAKRVGGVLVITKEQYESALEDKKKVQSNPSLKRRQGREEVKQKVIPLNPRKAGAGRVAVPVDSKAIAATPEEVAIKAQNVQQFRPKVAKGILN